MPPLSQLSKLDEYPFILNRVLLPNTLLTPTTPYPFTRPSQILAYKVYTRGSSSSHACTRCLKSTTKKVFKECVTLEGFLSNKCTNCHFSQASCDYTTTPTFNRYPSRARAYVELEDVGEKALKSLEKEGYNLEEGKYYII